MSVQAAAASAGSARETRYDRAFLIAVGLSFVPFLWKAVRYATLGSYLPGFVLVVLAAIAIAGARAGERAARWAVRVWAGALMLWGVARAVLLVLIVAADLNEAHLRAQIGVPFVLASVAACAAGALLWRRA